MDQPTIIPRKGPEAIIQARLITFLRGREWFVKSTHGNMYQSGFPDLYMTHPKYGARWVDTKVKDAYSFTAAQLETFPLLCAHGAGVWILTDDTHDEYLKLWQPPNWGLYLMMLHERGVSNTSLKKEIRGAEISREAIKLLREAGQ